MQIKLFFPGCDIPRPMNSNEISILLVGEPCVEFEQALLQLGARESHIQLKISSVPSIDRTVFDWKDLEPGLRIDYILILINPMMEDCLESVKKMLGDVDPVFYSRKRVDFCYVKHSIDISAVPVAKSKAFCSDYETSFQAIRVDDPGSVDYQARLCYNKAKRIICNPILF